MQKNEISTGENSRMKNYMDFEEFKKSSSEEIKEIINKYSTIEEQKENLEDFIVTDFMKSTELDILMQYHVYIDILKDIGNQDLLDFTVDFRNQFIKELSLGLDEKEIEELLEKYKEYDSGDNQEEVINLIKNVIKI